MSRHCSFENSFDRCVCSYVGSPIHPAALLTIKCKHPSASRNTKAPPKSSSSKVLAFIWCSKMALVFIRMDGMSIPSSAQNYKRSSLLRCIIGVRGCCMRLQDTKQATSTAQGNAAADVLCCKQPHLLTAVVLPQSWHTRWLCGVLVAGAHTGTGCCCNPQALCCTTPWAAAERLPCRTPC